MAERRTSHAPPDRIVNLRVDTQTRPDWKSRAQLPKLAAPVRMTARNVWLSFASGYPYPIYEICGLKNQVEEVTVHYHIGGGAQVVSRYVVGY